MSSDLLSIAASGTRAARAALDVTAQNIANAGTSGYVRRSIQLGELAAPGFQNTVGDLSLHGVRVLGIARDVDAFRQAELRRTGADAARADAQVGGLSTIDHALESANLYPALTQFQSALQQLGGNPADPALRAAVLADASTLAQSFNIAHTGLAQAGAGLRFDAGDAVTQVNTLAQGLAALNVKLGADPDPATNQAMLLDQRDQMLQQLSQFAGVTTQVAANSTVSVQVGGAQLVAGASASPLTMTSAADGTIAFTLGSSAVTMGAGSLAGKAQALGNLALYQSQLDGIAGALIQAANTAQGHGVALDGSAGQPLFSGTSAGTITLALTSGSQLATAPAGAGAGSRDPANLAALQNALAGAHVASDTDALLFAASAAVQGATTTRDALDAIASQAKTALDAQSGVNLDEEATNLLKYQQAFQASGKVMQVASTLFDSLLQIR